MRCKRCQRKHEYFICNDCEKNTIQNDDEYHTQNFEKQMNIKKQIDEIIFKKLTKIEEYCAINQSVIQNGKIELLRSKLQSKRDLLEQMGQKKQLLKRQMNIKNKLLKKVKEQISNININNVQASHKKQNKNRTIQGLKSILIKRYQENFRILLKFKDLINEQNQKKQSIFHYFAKPTQDNNTQYKQYKSVVSNHFCSKEIVSKDPIMKIVKKNIELLWLINRVYGTWMPYPIVKDKNQLLILGEQMLIIHQLQNLPIRFNTTFLNYAQANINYLSFKFNFDSQLLEINRSAIKKIHNYYISQLSQKQIPQSTIQIKQASLMIELEMNHVFGKNLIQYNQQSSGQILVYDDLQKYDQKHEIRQKQPSDESPKQQQGELKVPKKLQQIISLSSSEEECYFQVL